MKYFKKILGKTLGVIIFNGALYTIVKIGLYIVGVLYWIGLLNTLGIDYSFVRMDDYNFYIDGGLLSFNESYAKALYFSLILCVFLSLLFFFQMLSNGSKRNLNLN